MILIISSLILQRQTKEKETLANYINNINNIFNVIRF